MLKALLRAQEEPLVVSLWTAQTIHSFFKPRGFKQYYFTQF